MPTREEIRHAIYAIFAARGIDPAIAERVIQQESGLNPAAIGDQGRSFGLAQLYTGGGLGNVAEKRGIDIRDPNQWRRHLEFMADEVAKPGVGWKPWYGARDVGISQFQGVGGAQGATPTPAAPTTVANIQELQKRLLERYPELRVTSGYRDPATNARVGGAKNSQHTHGTAVDIAMRGIPEARQREIVEYARSLGARGLGYYPSNQSVHFDMRAGAPAAWGPNYSRTSLPQTPGWYQQIAQQHLQGKGVAPAAPIVASAGTANVKVPTQVADVTQGALAAKPPAPMLQPAPEPEPQQLTPPPVPPPEPDQPAPPMMPAPVDYAALMLPRIRRGLLGEGDYSMGLLGA